MTRTAQLLDRWGNPVRRQNLTSEIAAPTLGGVRSPLAGYPGDGLHPVRLANILRAADQGDPVQYLELAETIEERDPHYLGVLGTRKRSVSQIEVTVEAASDDPEDVKIADMVRDWLRRDELTDDLFHILDCIGKGYSFTEILWDASEGQWQPRELKWRDPRHFRFARHDLATPLLIDQYGQEVQLEPFHFIYANIPAKSGLALRSGLARVASWGWMFKAFTQRDWAIFTQTYGQPLRVGKWHPGASEADKDTLFRAVANIAGDCAAIIPDTMSLDFIESKNVGSSSNHYKERNDWLDQQISKAVLGNTGTTDAIAGGHAVGRVHRQVQEDIETADAKALAGILNRDLIRPWVMLEFGPRRRYPRLKIERPKSEDIKGMSEALEKLVPLGLEVQMSEVRDKLGFAEPDAGAKVLAAPKPPEASPPPRPSGQRIALQSESAANGSPVAPSPEALLLDQIDAETASDIEDMLATIDAVIEAAGSLEEAREMLIAAYPQILSNGMGAKLAQGMVLSWAMGRAEVADENG